MPANQLYLQIIAELVHLDHIRTMNILRLGPFPTLNAIEGMKEEMNESQQDEVEKMFGNGDLLDDVSVKELLTSIDGVFRQHMLKMKGEPKPGFGSKSKEHQKAMDDYRMGVMNILNNWQKKRETGKAKKHGSLAARAAYAMRNNAQGIIGRPLLTISYMEAMDYLLTRIPSIIREVSSQQRASHVPI